MFHSEELLVRSCYRRLQGEQVWGNAKISNKLWCLDLPSKVTNFMWRVCRNCLPSGVNLVSKRVHIKTACS